MPSRAEAASAGDGQTPPSSDVAAVPFHRDRDEIRLDSARGKTLKHNGNTKYEVLVIWTALSRTNIKISRDELP